MARRTPKKTAPLPTVDVVFFTLPDPATLAVARAGALEWLNENAGGDCGSRVDEMFPTAVSSTGAGPATGFICAGEYSPAAARGARLFIERNQLPVAVIESDLPAFLASQKLSIIPNG